MLNKLSINNKLILIVGGAGFVGSNLCHYLLNNYDAREIWIVDNLLSSDIINVPIDGRVHFIFGSIADESILGQLPENIEVVFHLACYHGNQSSIANPLADHENNTLTSLKLFELLKSYKKIQKVVYAAAGCAVAEKTFDSATATSEDAPVSLFHDSPYSISKLIGEMYGNYYWMQYNLPFVKARFQNVYGPREILGAGRWRGTVHTVWRNVIPTFIWKALHEESLPLDNDGLGTRDFIYVEDIVRGLIACAENGDPGEAYNIASGVETSISDLASLINKISGNKTPVDKKPARAWDRSGKRFGSTDKSRIKLGFKANLTLQEGIQRTVDWTKENEGLIQRTISNHNVMMQRMSSESQMKK